MIEAVMPLWGASQTPIESASVLTGELIPLERMLDLNHQWHSALPKLAASAAKWSGDLVLPIAAVHDGAVYSVSLVTRPIAANRMRWPLSHVAELRRLAVAPYAPKFTATRSLRIMRTMLREASPETCTLISYQATDVHSGTIYRADNWQSDGAPGATAGSDGKQHRSWNDRWDGKTHGADIDQNVSIKVRWRYALRPKCRCERDWQRDATEAQLTLNDVT